jgi:hypothetical protein
VIALRAGAWSPVLAVELLPAFDGNIDEAVMVADRVRRADVEVIDVFRDGRMVGRGVVAFGREAEVLALVGAGLDSMPDFEALAKLRGCVAVVFDTWRPGLMRALSAGGFRAVSCKFWKAI